MSIAGQANHDENINLPAVEELLDRAGNVVLPSRVARAKADHEVIQPDFPNDTCFTGPDDSRAQGFFVLPNNDWDKTIFHVANYGGGHGVA